MAEIERVQPGESLGPGYEEILREALEWIHGCFIEGQRKTYGDPDETLDKIRERAAIALDLARPYESAVENPQ